MRHALANWLNERGRHTDDAVRAIRFYKAASWVEPRWSVPWYNLGFQAKYLGRWEDSLRFNHRAVELNAQDKDAWWNLGIAATALRDWSAARRAWKGFGINLADGDGEVTIPALTACVRLDPNRAGEVVWGKRLDPARILVLNVPLPESKRRYCDVILNDGAPNGTRNRDGAEIPVFDELEVWQASSYSTFQVALDIPSQEAEEKLAEVCEARRIGVEDWSTIRILCAECSRGNPHQHEHKPTTADELKRRFGFAATNREELENLLIDWASGLPDADYRDIELMLEATPNGSD
jgi:tetratricopeptide (TPR) repeat protein